MKKVRSYENIEIELDENCIPP